MHSLPTSQQAASLQLNTLKQREHGRMTLLISNDGMQMFTTV